MTILAELKTIVSDLGLQSGVSVFEGKAPDEFVVFVPIGSTFEQFADDLPQYNSPEIRISLFTRNNFYELENALTKSLIQHDFTITERTYVDFEEDTKYHHIAIDVEKIYTIDKEK